MVRLLPVVVLAAIVLAVVGCRSVPEEPVDAEEEFGLVLQDLPQDGAVLDNDDVWIGIDPARLPPEMIEAVLVRIVPGGERRVTPEDRPGGLTFRLPLEGLEDGGLYTVSLFLVLTDGGELSLGTPFSISIDLGLPRPEPWPMERRTLNPRPRLSWRYPDGPGRTEPAGMIVSVEGEPRELEEETDRDEPVDGELYGSARLRDAIVGAADIRQGDPVSWRVRTVSSGGVLGPVSPEGFLLYDPAQNVPEVLSARTGDLSIVSRPGFSWTVVDGAERYHLEVWFGSGDSSEDDVREITLEENRYRLSVDQLEELLQSGDSPNIRWRVGAENEVGVKTPWSSVQTVRQAVLMSATATVLPPEATVRVIMGAPPGTSGARSHEIGLVEVVLDRPFGLGRNLLTTEAVAELFNQGIRVGTLELDPDGRLRDATTGQVLLALDALDFGSQFGLHVQEGKISYVPEYRSHPAVGVSWYGAVWLMNRLSFLAGRRPVYRTVTTDQGIRYEADFDLDGYRLPTEAEWALAAGQTRRVQPGGETQSVEVHRDLSSVELRGINYLRSGDAWEDPEPPYTRAGGPTNPAGALGPASPAGIHDLLGNVWEWVWDWYDPQRDPSGELPRNFTGPDSARPDVYGREMRVVRGGAWNVPRDALRPTMRGSFLPGASSHSIGVRPARTLQP